MYESLPLVRGQTLEIRPGRHLDVAYRRGDVQADTVVFFAHGGGGNKDQWREQWRDLAARGYSLVAWDLLGHGASRTPRADSAYAWSELVADQVAVLQRYAGRRNVVVAHSFGTGLSLSALAARARDGWQADAALLLGTQAERPLPSGKLLRLPAWALELLRPILSSGFRERAWHASADPALVAYEEKLTRRNRLHVFKALIGQAAWPGADDLAQLRLPVGILAGDSDGLTPAERGRVLHERLPGSTFEVLAECGHQLMLERPARVNQHLQQLLSALP
ncbi:MAG: hypothetical protein GAK45_00169 [Pseudomonas citronellolis]|nr:MAG: hypothetical protein GAK45_00169 [Pseudomonas citronellolis]